MGASGNVFGRLLDIVRRVPPGRVATYGQISQHVLGSTPRMVGFALAGLGPESDVPWHRIVNAAGRISLPEEGASHALQRSRLEAEGVLFSPAGAIDLQRFGTF
jgi:methylated-DNA-protein-cysteine methyltransferase-like protein